MATTKKKTKSTASKAQTGRKKSTASARDKSTGAKRSTTSRKRAPAKRKDYRPRLIGGAICFALAVFSAFGYFGIDAVVIRLLVQLEQGLAGYGYWITPVMLLWASIILIFHDGMPVRLRFARHLADGRVGLLVDGLPVGLLLPVTLSAFLRVTGDSSMHFLVSSLLTLLRWLALGAGLLLPALYTAVALYHQEMIPTRLLQSIIQAEQDLPFPTALEVLGMLAAFSLLQEAGLRMPNPIGDTVSIIGALIVGQAAVEAKLVSPIAIIVVATSGICCYTLPSQDLGFAVRLTRLLLLLGAVFGGLFGIAWVGCLTLLHLADLDSFGTAYASPLSSGSPGGLAKLLLRLPGRYRKGRKP